MKISNRTRIIPTLRYKNAQTAIEWLCKAFGFREHLLVKGDNDAIAHAQLTYGHAMIMIASVGNDEYGKHIHPPEYLNGANSQALYVIVENIDEHYRRTLQAGGEILIDIKDEDYGGRGYTCRDIEGHLWSFGSYNPWLASD